MPFEVQNELDLARLEMLAQGSQEGRNPPAPRSRSGQEPEVLNVADLLALDVAEPKMLIDGLLPTRGACLMFGTAKSGKTLLAVQAALAVASGTSLFDHFRVLEAGPALVVEQDDAAGAASVKTILQRSQISVDSVPFFLSPRVPFDFGLQLLEWLEGQIVARTLHLVVLDSYTALRASRGPGIDIVKAEQNDMTLLDDLAKRTGAAIIVVHHDSKGSAGMHWAQRAAGTFAMSAATEVQIHISRFGELDSMATERLVRIQGRHLDGTELVLRFRKATLDYECILEGDAAALYPLMRQIQSTMGAQVFSPKELSQLTGVSRSTAHRQIDRLHRAGALTKRGFGEYMVTVLKDRDTGDR